MKSYNAGETEEKFQTKWEEEKIYHFNSQSEKENFIIDTPPPTVSGALHIGHIFSYTQTDILARFQRMLGKNVFYPMGWDDNGLPTEKRIQNLYNVKCDPLLNPVPGLSIEKRTSSKKKQQKALQPVSRKNFLEICAKQVLEDEIKYKSLWKRLGLSVDWNQTYQTIGPHSQKLAQFSFLDLYKKNLVTNQFSPVLWDTQFQTAVAQADIEDREQKGFYHDIRFQLASDKKSFVISTTRPELLPACIAVAAHPEDERYKKFFHQKAITPLFHSEVPLLPSTHADPEKGTGILMICTFGDMEDAVFWKNKNLPLLQIIDEEGFLKDISFHSAPFNSLKPEEASRYYSELKGLRVKAARSKIVEILKEKNLLTKEPKETIQRVKYYEKGDFPLEILPKRQWYINILDHKEALLAQGKKIKWHPESMRKRYEQWVEGLNQNWCISRQRFYGVPFPVWYPLKEEQVDYENPLLPPLDIKSLPVDPLKQTPEGFRETERNQAKGFQGDNQVMDTWAVSSLTPFINSGWVSDLKKHKSLFPAHLRPQAHEIIRTWAFYTIAKSWMHEKSIPWQSIAISGWVVNPDRLKMSKSKGNAVTPEKLMELYSADGVRYWAGKARLGQDTVYDENLFKTGKRLVTKIFNASRFVTMQTESHTSYSLADINEPIDKAWICHLIEIQKKATENLKAFDYASALDDIEKTFWAFCDNYLELVKARVYQLKDQPEGLSGKAALDYSIYSFLKLFAPYLPYVTEEIWSLRYKKKSASVHSAAWVEKESLPEWINSYKEPSSLLNIAFFILEQVRSQKSNLRKSLATPLKSLRITANSENLKQFPLFKEDILKATHVSPENLHTVLKTSLTHPEIETEI